METSGISEFWPDWKLGELIGEGSYGKVYKAYNNANGIETQCAVKIVSVPNSIAEYEALRSEGMTLGESRTYLEGIVTDFANEIKLMSALKGAPHIVSVEDYKIIEKTDTVGWNIYIRMEILKSFKQHMEDTVIDEDEVIKLGVEIATALEICEKANIIHRDIKPANIFVSKFGEYKLGDFGIAKELEKTSGAMSSKGTFTYMAPEVAHGMRYDSTVDIYSLGIVMYSLLNNNRQPFVDPYAAQVTYNMRREANEKRLAGERIPAPCNAGERLSNIILTACAYDPKNRFRSAAAFKNALLSCKNGRTAFVSPHVSADSNETKNSKENSADKIVNSKNEIKEKNNKRGLLIGATLIAFAIIILIISLIFIPGENVENELPPIPDTAEKRGQLKKETNIHGVTDERETERDSSVTEDVSVPENGFDVDYKSEGNIEWAISDNVLYIKGKGNMADYNNYSELPPWSDNIKEIDEIIIEGEITSIGNYAFYNAKNLTNIVLPDTLERIGDACFMFCDSLSDINLPSGLKEIGECVFQYTSSMDSISIPAGVVSIGKKSFCLAHDIQRIEVDEANLYYKSVDGVLYTKDGSELVAYPKSKVGKTYTVPEGVINIAEDAFTGTKLEAVELPSTLETISSSAFSQCKSLKEMSIPDKVTSIKSYTFSHCTALKSVYIHDLVDNIDPKAFYECTSVVIVCSEDSYAHEYAMTQGLEYLN